MIQMDAAYLQAQQSTKQQFGYLKKIKIIIRQNNTIVFSGIE